MAKKFIRGNGMEYYIYMLVSLAVMLMGIKLVFCELEGRTAQKKGFLSWYIKYNEPFKYARTRSIILMCVVCYMIASIQPFFSVEPLATLIPFTPHCPTRPKLLNYQKNCATPLTK